MSRDQFTARLRLAGVVIVLAFLAGCATRKMGPPQASIDDVQSIRAAKLMPAVVGDFSLAPGVKPDMDASVGIRALTLESPFDSSFAKYLRETLAAELAAAGLLDPSSKARIEGLLSDVQVDAGMSTGTAKLSARFMVKIDGAAAYDREQSVTASWDSSFVGAVAIPRAADEFTALFRKLVIQLLSDPDFRKTLQPAS